MKVILQKAVQKVGKAGDIVEVSDGYANNALFPRKLAIPATEKALATLKRTQDSVASKKALEHELLEKAISSLSEGSLTITMRANEKGHLFSKVTEEDIVSALALHRVMLSKKNIILSTPIRTVGTHTVRLQEGSYKKDIAVTVLPQSEK